MSLLCVLDGIGHEVRDDLVDALTVESCLQRGVWVLFDEGHIGRLHALCQCGADVIEILCEVCIDRLYADAAFVEFRYGQHIVDQSQ